MPVNRRKRPYIEIAYRYGDHTRAGDVVLAVNGRSSSKLITNKWLADAAKEVDRLRSAPAGLPNDSRRTTRFIGSSSRIDGVRAVDTIFVSSNILNRQPAFHPLFTARRTGLRRITMTTAFVRRITLRKFALYVIVFCRR